MFKRLPPHIVGELHNKLTKQRLRGAINKTPKSKVINPPTPSITPTNTPTISLTPSITPTISLTPTNTPPEREVTIDIFTITYNEEKIIPYFIKHYSQYGNITIYDNYSTDDTEKIALENGVKVIKYDSNNQIRDDLYLEIKNNCWKDSEADWVIVCDADEFIYHPDLINMLKATKSTIFVPAGYDMVSETFPTTDSQIYDEIQFGTPSSGMCKMCLFNPKEIKEIDFTPGCHSAYPKGNVIKQKNDPDLKLLHMKALSREYVINKHKVYSKRLSAENNKHGWGYHYHWDDKTIHNYFNKTIKNSKKVI